MWEAYKGAIGGLECVWDAYRGSTGFVGSFEVDVDGVWEAYKAAIGGLGDV